MDTAKRMNISMLNDSYGELLTKHQSEMIRLYYDLDVSLNEIAEQYSISRQAVRDAIMRGEKALLEFEDKLHIVAKTSTLVERLNMLKAISDDGIKAKIDEIIELVEGE